MDPNSTPINRSALGLALAAFGLINLGVILYFAEAIPIAGVKVILVLGIAVGLLAWWRLRASGA